MGPTSFVSQDVVLRQPRTLTRVEAQLDTVQRDGTTTRLRSLSQAWSIQFVAVEWDDASDENVMEQMKLTYDSFFELVQ